MTDAGNNMKNMIDGATTHLHPAYSYPIWGKKHFNNNLTMIFN